ncbi:PfkB family carbohydrate kinase [Actinomyces sp. B33]|uniref:PfkB family carbohydrate kinase n=1 Tax=Actinomyces sp. B33 TaxID=2942131 RepID=UPI002340CE66|nr:PfkB family carbohydrate kinase [Actinomyces sp. B33]MDC4233047.1 PfkB family carbohydrate kinase [Actinomyces sp. B33]
MTGRFISTHSVVLVLPMNISYMPAPGGSVHADAAGSRPGGGFTTLSTVAALGVRAALASPLGTGPNSFTVRQQLAEAGVEVLTQELVGDIGVAIQLIEETGSMTSIVTAGVESEPSRASLDHLVLTPGDLIYVSGTDLTNPYSAKVLGGWAASLPASVRLVIGLSPAVEQVPVEAWKQVLGRADLVTMNLRESAALTKILASYSPASSIRELMRPEAGVVRRMGARGCEVQADADAEFVPIAPYESTVADTAGVGDTHVATMCAGLLMGMSLTEACTMANAAAAIAISHESALPVPTREQVDAVMATGRVSDAPVR